MEHKFDLLESVINVNNKQRVKLVELAKEVLGDLYSKRIAILGLAFKPNTDDMREAASIIVAKQLLLEGAHVVAYDPIAIENAKKIMPAGVRYARNTQEALEGADAVFILTEWQEFKELPIATFKQFLQKPIIFDGRNCFNLNDAKNAGVHYYSIGRPYIEVGKNVEASS